MSIFTFLLYERNINYTLHFNTFDKSRCLFLNVGESKGILTDAVSLIEYRSWRTGMGAAGSDVVVCIRFSGHGPKETLPSLWPDGYWRIEQK